MNQRLINQDEPTLLNMSENTHTQTQKEREKCIHDRFIFISSTDDKWYNQIMVCLHQSCLV